MHNNHQFTRNGTEIYLKSTGDLILDQIPSEEKADLILRVMNGFQVTYNDLEFTAHMFTGSDHVRLTGADQTHLFDSMIAFSTGVASSQTIMAAIAEDQESKNDE